MRFDNMRALRDEDMLPNAIEKFVEDAMDRYRQWATGWANEHVLDWKQKNEANYSSTSALKSAFARQLPKLSKVEMAAVWKVQLS